MKDAFSLSLPNIDLIGVIGRGGMASVWRGRQVSLDRHVAVKVLSKDFSADPDDVQRFRQEAKAAASLKHPGIVQVYDANFSDGVYYFVMELVEGYTMGDLARRKGRLSVEDALTVAESVAVAMDYAWSHFKMVHCDIKPDNIMVDADGTIKVTDLGLCRSMALVKGGEGGGEAEEVLGTPAYMSPEQVYGSAVLDCRSDIYALGATLYHLVTGRMLFMGNNDDDVMRGHVGKAQAPDVRQYAKGAGGPFALLLEKMLAKDPGRRHQDWRMLLADLGRVRLGHPPWPVMIPPGGSSMLRDVNCENCGLEHVPIKDRVSTRTTKDLNESHCEERGARHGRLSCNGKPWSEHVERAETVTERLRGLLGRDGIADGGAMLIERCGVVHTVGMRFALGLVFLDRAWRVTRLARDVRPGRLAVWGGWRAVRVIEVPAGSRLLDGLAPGDHFAWEG